MSALSDHDRADAGFPEPVVERDSLPQCFWLILGGALLCWLVIVLPIAWWLR